jgi:ribosomal protein L34E
LDRIGDGIVWEQRADLGIYRYNTKSNKVRVIKTPGGKLRYLHLKKAGTAPKCGDCGIKLPGVSLALFLRGDGEEGRKSRTYQPESNRVELEMRKKSRNKFKDDYSTPESTPFRPNIERTPEHRQRRSKRRLGRLFGCGILLDYGD